MVGFTEGTYEPKVRTRNRVTIAVTTSLALAACVIGGFATSWPMSNAVASAVLVLIFGGSFWWMFASNKAGPVRQSDMSKYWARRTLEPFKSRRTRK